MYSKFKSVSSNLCVTAATLSLGFASIAMHAQTDTGRVTGIVEDPTEASIPGATITIINTSTSETQTVKADAAGNFNFPALQRGPYKITATMSGFQTTTQSFDLQVSQVQTITFKLSVGSTDQTVEVTSAAPMVELGSSTIGGVVQSRQQTELPLNGRNFTQLALLSPGVTRGNYGNGASGVNGDAETFRNSSSGGGSLSTNGLRPQANNYILDGVDNNEGLVNTLNFFPNVEATEEFRVNTSTAPAEFGRAGGAIVQTSIKSGSNSVHGSAYWFARSSLFDASPNYSFLGATPAAVQPFKRNVFGGAIGGPVIKDKLFLFGDYSGSRENQPLNAQLLSVPTLKMRSGNFSELLGTGATQVPTICGVAGAAATVPVNGGIYDPTTCQQFAGNIIPTARLNAAAVNYLNAYPLPNAPGILNGTQNNYQTVRTDIRLSNTIDGRVDYNIGHADRLFARFSYDNSNFSRTSEFPNLPAGYASGSNYVHARGYVLGETHTFSQNAINELRAGYTRYTFANQPVFSNTPISANLGIVNANRTTDLGGGALIGGNGSQLEYTGDYGTYKVPENTYQINDALTYLWKGHTFKFGGNAIRREVAYFRPISGKGYFQLGNGDFTGYDTSEVLAGFADTYSIGAQSGLFGTRNYEVGAFGQDDWKVTRRLTLNLGVRWDLITYPTEEHDRQAALNPNSTGANPTELIAGQNGVGRSIINTRFTNFAPRFGFSYDLTGQGKTVLRGGYGIFYFLDRGGIDNQLGQQVPFGGSTSYYASNGSRITFTGQSVNGSQNSALATTALPLPTTSSLTGANVFAVNQTEKIPTVQQYDLQIQHEITPKMVMTVGYVGNLSTHLATGYNFNSKPFSAGATAPTAFPTLGQVVYNLNDGVSHYNSLQAQLNYRASKSLTLTSSYTWAHNIDNTNGYLGFYAVSDLNYYDHSLNKGNSSLDQKHVFVASALYSLPFGRGQMFGNGINRGVDAVLGGWQLNTIVQAQTGTPFSVTFPVYGGGTSIRADYANNGQPIYQKNIAGFYLNPAAFSSVQPVGRQGNTGRNQFFGPGTAQGDVSLFKTLGITERFKTELRAEVFNVTNTPQFQNPDGSVGDATAAAGATSFSNSTTAGNFGRITSTRLYSERQMQMAIRFLF